jgi:hypothetical protein
MDVKPVKAVFSARSSMDLPMIEPRKMATPYQKAAKLGLIRLKSKFSLQT